MGADFSSVVWGAPDLFVSVPGFLWLGVFWVMFGLGWGHFLCC